MRANEFIVEGWADTAKSLAAGAGKGISKVAQGAGNVASDMLNKVKDTDTDWLKGQMYRFGGGKFGQAGNIAATKNIFIKNFVQEYNQISRAAKQSGMDIPSMEEYVNDYLAQVGWNAKPEQISKIATSGGGNIQNVANGVYAIGMMNQRGSRSKSAAQGSPNSTSPDDATGGPAEEPMSFGGQKLNPNDPADARMIKQIKAQQGQHAAEPSKTASGQDIELAPTTDKILQTIEKMTGASYSDDLERITNTALQQLYGSNKSAYAAARKAIINPTPQQPTARIEPTMNESSRKTINFSNRHK